MKEEELRQYQKLTAFQKTVVDAIKELGFEHMYFDKYGVNNDSGWGEIKVTYFKCWSDVLKAFQDLGKNQKQSEFQKVLGL